MVYSNLKPNTKTLSPRTRTQCIASQPETLHKLTELNPYSKTHENPIGINMLHRRPHLETPRSKSGTDSTFCGFGKELLTEIYLGHSCS